MKVAFRDDDTAYFTKPEELERAYDFMTEEDCISLSIVPFTVPVHRDDVFPYGEGIVTGYYDIEDNKELIKYLIENVNKGKYNLLLHGYSHEYQRVNGKWVAEMLWKSEERIFRELEEGKTKLDRIFGINTSVFVAPNNCINQKGIHAIEKLGMNFSGIIQHKDRDIDFLYIANYIRRWTVRSIKKIPYPGVLRYSRHNELVSYTADSYERLVYEYEMCKKKDEPFVVYTHYWKVNSDARLKELLIKIYKYIKADGATVVGLSECLIQ